MVNVFNFLSNIDFCCLGNTNKDLNFEYGDGTNADWGCGATLHNEFWYFGGWAKYQRQVKMGYYLLTFQIWTFFRCFMIYMRS